jgi:hypothetical protein
MVVFKLVATVHINSLATPNVNKIYIIQGEGWLNKNDVTWGGGGKPRALVCRPTKT